MKTFVTLAVLACMTMAANASGPVGKLADVQGNVTVGSDGQVVKASNGTPLMERSTIVVASGAKATVLLGEGCVISLKANQHLVLNPKLTCSQQVAAVSQLFSPYRVAQTGADVSGPIVGTTVGSQLLIGGAIVVLGVVALDNASTSGN